MPVQIVHPEAIARVDCGTRFRNVATVTDATHRNRWVVSIGVTTRRPVSVGGLVSVHQTPAYMKLLVRIEQCMSMHLDTCVYQVRGRVGPRSIAVVLYICYTTSTYSLRLNNIYIGY